MQSILPNIQSSSYAAYMDEHHICCCKEPLPGVSNSWWWIGTSATKWRQQSFLCVQSHAKGTAFTNPHMNQNPVFAQRTVRTCNLEAWSPWPWWAMATATTQNDPSTLDSTLKKAKAFMEFSCGVGGCSKEHDWNLRPISEATARIVN